MDLFDEELLKPKKKKQIQPTTIILAAIITLIILCIIVVVAIVYLKGTILTISIDGITANELEDILIIEENNKVYMPIRKMAEYLKYQSYNGDYTNRSEDATKCYIENLEELVSFTLDSNVITKVIDGQSQQIKITEPIKEINGELCITAEGAQDAFNLQFYYDVEHNNIIIQTLSYLYNIASTQAINNGYVEIEEETFANKTAVLDGMIIVKAQNGNFGVISTTNNEEMILETKYDSIQYLRKSSDFLVGSNSKKGIISKDRSTKVDPTYDSIEKITNKNDTFYLVEKSDLYGLLDVNGQTVIFPEYQKIGIDVTAYSQNGVTNGYILYNQIVPVQRNNKWALFNIDGTKITDFIYDSFGCPTAKAQDTSVTYGVIEVFDYNLIVACQNRKYNLITLEGNGLFDDYILDSVYITVTEGKNVYYITSGEQTRELIGFLQENKVTKPIAIE